MSEELDFLKKENERLKAILTSHGIDFNDTPHPPTLNTKPCSERKIISDQNKIRLFRGLFKGRPDVFAVRWESAKGRSGYSPACRNEWKPGICDKRNIRCAECLHRDLIPISDQVIDEHLSGRRTIGVYPLLENENCFFLAADFDGKEWQEDSLAFIRACRELEIPASREISRSGKGAHVWIFFSESVPAREARRLGSALISYTCSSNRQLAFNSYDRFFPNQDKMPKGGFGNLIALPLQGKRIEQNRTVFLDDSLVPFPDQWNYLDSVTPLPAEALGDVILRTGFGENDLDIGASPEEETPWKRPEKKTTLLPRPLPAELEMVIANQIFFPKKDLTQPLSNRLIRLSAFQNPEFYKAQAMRFSVWNKPRIISCAENHPKHIGIPRGCLEPALELLDQNGVTPRVRDEREHGSKIDVEFTGKLRKDQQAAVKKMLQHDTGVLCAPTAFGKTVTAVALIANRGVSTLILVHRTELLRQWLEQTEQLLKIKGKAPGQIGGGKKKPSGMVDIAVMQTLSRMDDLPELLDKYGHIVVDECHHISAFSFESIMKQAKCKYITGLTATPIRRDGHHPIIFMQCGPLRHSALRPETAPQVLEVRPQFLPAPQTPEKIEIQELLRLLADDSERARRISQDVLQAYDQGRKILVLTERTSHLEVLKQHIGEETENFFILHGRLSAKKRSQTLAALGQMNETSPRIILATGKLIGEGFDHPPLDTLFLAMPISWKGTLQQYCGRLHREHIDKERVLIYDYVEMEHPMLARMWGKRLKGYRAMGYKVIAQESDK